MRIHGRIRIDQHLEALLLKHYGTDPFPYTYTEQDLYEQTRKFIAQYNQEYPAAATNLSEPDVARNSETTGQKGGNWQDQSKELSRGLPVFNLFASRGI